ncbi:hypothetical protein [Microbacterium excoecariae]|uniref:hypothetical protein n=1 Tax=Microbacterium excoecariae TaxID=2715210 RepID=UPI00140DCADE|nr:hypothetical protein [Microbacterium excoecariae]NHI16031.1 hypothetical protein [Microbacterium excoecariae]
MTEAPRRRVATMNVSTTDPGWLMIPDDLDAAERAAWPGEVAARILEAWSGTDTTASAEVLEHMLHASLEVRGADDFVFEVWPFAAAIRSRVRMNRVAVDEIPAWEDLGYTVMPYESLSMGDGYIATGSSAAALGDESTTMFRSAVVFADAEMAVVVFVEPTPEALYLSTLVGLQGVVDSIEIDFADGSRFRATPPARFVTDRDAEWPDGAEGAA